MSTRFFLLGQKRRRAGVATLLLLALALPIQAAKVYKWVDDEGQVHYGGKPPEKESQSADKIPVLGAQQAMATLRIRNDYEYCGKLRLPGPIHNRKRIFSSLRDRREEWQERLQRNERAQRDIVKRQATQRGSRRSGYGSSNDSRKRSQKEASELRCALAWAERKQENLGGIRNDVETELDIARNNLEILQQRANRACGPDPGVDSRPSGRRTQKNWKSCMRRYRSQISRSERDVKKLETEMRNIR